MEKIFQKQTEAVVISIIITVRNGSKWINNCFQTIVQQSLLKQSIEGDHENKLSLEISVFDDHSCDNTIQKLYDWQEKLSSVHRIPMYVTRNEIGHSKGVGYGRNQAIRRATGAYLCFQDIDDEMHPDRLLKQYELAREHPRAIIGCKFERIPENATKRFVKWANRLSSSQLHTQIYTANGPTVIMPTWMCHRQVYERVQGGFSEAGAGCPEDLIFFYQHLDNGGEVLRVDECLLKYRYHPESTTFNVAAETIWNVRLQHLIINRLQNSPWKEGFTIWNAGKQGRRLFRHLPAALKGRVRAFCDVDSKKIQKHYNYYDGDKRCFTFRIPIVHFRKMQLPVIVCMKLDLTCGEFERNLASLHLTENKDYILFS